MTGNNPRRTPEQQHSYETAVCWRHPHLPSSLHCGTHEAYACAACHAAECLEPDVCTLIVQQRALEAMVA